MFTELRQLSISIEKVKTNLGVLRDEFDTNAGKQTIGELAKVALGEKDLLMSLTPKSNKGMAAYKRKVSGIH